MLESTFKKQVLKDLKSIQGLWILKSQERARSGVPDLLICAWGQFIAIELKRNSKSDATPLQIEVLKRIQAAGGFAFVACPETWSAQLEILQGMEKAK